MSKSAADLIPTPDVLNLGDGVVYVTVEVLSTRLRVPPSTLRRWAKEDGWPTRKIKGRFYYHWETAANAYNARGRHFRDTRRIDVT